jgi:isoleucyl-tRNA synthetase
MATQTDKPSYKQTLNLPQTPFPMEAKLTANEPARLASWQAMDLYRKVLDGRADAPLWVLHDGPPFANGDIHLGHVINKTLKDVILRFKTLQGNRTPYVPGWDCHGLPIEHKIADEAKKAGERLHELGALEVRRRCYAYAEKYAAVQSEQFQRLGILGDWAHPYLTMTRDYEASTLEVFAKFVEAGLVYRKLKPVPWSIANQTALADAELEYKDVDDVSVYVEFPRTDGDGTLLIWTTTPWTLPANLAIAAGPDVTYVRAKFDGRTTVVARELAERVFKQAGKTYEVVGTLTGRELDGLTYRHPFVDRVGKVVLADYVTTDAGTGLVHTAPGHGEDDYETGLREQLDVYSPVLANGKYDDTVPEWLLGKSVWEANKLIPPHLRELGALFAEEKINHSYPHDWRSKTPIIFRATEQWFVAMDKGFAPSPGTPGEGGGEGLRSSNGAGKPEDPHPNPLPEYRERGPEGSLRERALSAVSADVEFVPKWGQARITGMLSGRPDWCISRQRAWGLPIPVFYNDRGDPLLTPASVRAVAKRVAEVGSDCWFTEEPAALLGADFAYPDGFTATNLRKERDIFDVWFESGSSWHAVLSRPGLRFPADLYLEGSDQHRGWFQLSMLPSLGATGRPPFRQVLTHGFIVKPDGTKVSKSDKEYVTATQEINTHGADLLRLWCCSVDYQTDIPTSPKVIKEFGDKYRKVRNTLRYLLSNLYDYDGPSGSTAVDVPPGSLDGWVLDQFDALVRDTVAAYDAYQIHRAFRLLHDFCSVQVSAVYGNAMKDRLYCDAATSPLRRRSQMVMHRLVLGLTKLLSPMVVFTADEAWGHIPHKPAPDAGLASVHLARLPEPSGQAVSDQVRADWATMMSLREAALGQLDELKKSAGLNKASEALVTYTLPDGLRERLAGYGVDLEDVVGCGHHEVAAGETAVRVTDARATLAACARCWKRRPDVTGELCGRCAAAVGGVPA